MIPSIYSQAIAATLFLMLVGLANGAAAEVQEFNRRATATAQIMAGIPPVGGEPALERLTTLDVFAEHQKWMAAQWGQVRGRISAMQNWRSQKVKIPGATQKTLLYPFSGPDFFNAYALFPEHSQYIFFSLERPSSLPDLESVTAVQFGKLLEDVRNAFRDIFQRNYFITDYMNKQLTTPWIRGTVPVMATMMVLMNQRIVRIEPVDLFPELTRAYEARDTVKHPRMIMRGTRIVFAGANGGAQQQLYYFSLDATDKALEFYPGFLEWVGQHRPASALLKSASYLLHDNQFEKTRNMIMAAADYVVQDDTGIPYRFLRQAPWQVRLYGRYNKPIKSLRYGYQADLEGAYKEKPDLAELPFPFGYHWRGKQSGLMIANR
ncbi:MAG: hypothetical protein Q8S00_21855 [Deltaproteobacteria bacterium]|nr:hypothetical protein [Deltaproteobacteria bacterium]MDZ4345419.1 hypothetical protein [Candidatus Binatia bacterium]